MNEAISETPQRDASLGADAPIARGGDLPKWWPSANPYIIGDNLDIMPLLPDDCIDLTVTSPPYDNLREYGGHTWNFDKFKDCAKQLFRITKPGGVVVWVVGDATIDGSETGTSFRQALYFKEVGFNLHDTMIWNKDGGGAVGSNKCYTQNWEFMFVFSKGTPKCINLIYDKPNKSFGQDKSGVGRRLVSGEHKIENRKPSAEFSRRNNYWYIPTERGEHPAVFPVAVAHDHIVSWSNPGAIVLDPFAGSGTTLHQCRKLDRVGLGIEINPKYEALLRDRSMSNIARLDAFAPPRNREGGVSEGTQQSNQLTKVTLVGKEDS